ncbi:MAG: hypothetical protein HY900_29585 [Deltaproteobacteria bacterium]|nr:hypothetical protein [Deltaproteobacteria bacterium]
MKRALAIVLAVLCLTVATSSSMAGSRGKMDLKAGDEIFACGCDGCPCQTLASNAGKCGCGQDLVKAKVSSVKKGAALLKAEGWKKERPFKLAGKFACACPPECPCNTQAQQAGTCTCGKEMKKVKS